LPLHRLDVLGRIEFGDEQSAPLRAVLVQPKRLALLVYLALNSRAGAVRRDKLVATFWPELDQERARRALNNAVYFLRQALGETVIVSRGIEELSVDRSQFSCDAVDFLDALERQNETTALALYRGDLLPAFYIEGAPDFERWLDDTRVQLRRRAADAASALAERQEREGNGAAAVTWARRALELSDEDERKLRLLLQLLDRLGDRAGALDAYERFELRLDSEFGASPAAETRAVIAAIRATSDVSDEHDRTASPKPSALTLAMATSGGKRAWQWGRRRAAAAAAAAALIAVVVAISVVAVNPPRQRRVASSVTVDPRAEAIYKRALNEANRGTPASTHLCIAAAEEALAVDPRYAAAYALAARCYARVPNYGAGSPVEYYPRAKAAAVMAITLDSSRAEAFATLGWVTAMYDRDWPEAEKAYRHVIALDPNGANRHANFAWFLAWGGRFEEAFAELRRARELAPQQGFYEPHAAVFYAARRYDDAIREARRGLAADPSFLWLHIRLADALIGKEHYAEAIEVAKRIAVLDTSPGRYGLLTKAYAVAGRRAEARRLLQSLLREPARSMQAPSSISLLYVALGDRSEALDWLERAYRMRDGNLVLLRVWPQWDPLRNEPRFQAVLRGMNFPPS